MAVLAPTLVATRRHRVVVLEGNGPGDAVRHVDLVNVTLAHAEATYMQPYEVCVRERE